MEILVGVVLERVASPKAIENTKSAASNAPLPPSVLNTASDIETDKVVLFAAKDTPVIIGLTLSFNVAELLV